MGIFNEASRIVPLTETSLFLVDDDNIRQDNNTNIDDDDDKHFNIILFYIL